ncbi:nucleoside monophosphate kinase [Bacteriovoracaceae bacterium]|nr:nucleoside monophosphate kinase [Bacteriovoracaceae bacterium]|tara:strand:+ start:10930 stop:11571 length:642 start_codon:yes stop_codon:yes gene_type:complete
MKPQLILLGAPGSGKGTQAARLVSELSYTHISTGELLRSEISSGSELGNRVQSIMNEGKLVDDNTVLELLSSNCDLDTNAYIFDGFPRNIEQAKLLDDVLIKEHASKAVYFDIDLDKLAERLINRRTCDDCGEIYNLLSKAPKVEGVCDKCKGTNLAQRKDDNKETVVTRLEVFKNTIEPVLEYYESQGKLTRLDASKGADGVFEQLENTVKN